MISDDGHGLRVVGRETLRLGLKEFQATEVLAMSLPRNPLSILQQILEQSHKMELKQIEQGLKLQPEVGIRHSSDTPLSLNHHG